MKEMRPYRMRLERLLERCVSNQGGAKKFSLELENALDGEASRVLRKRVSLSVLREKGAFFTGSDLADGALRLLNPSKPEDSVFLDPACGAGDLLVAASRHLPLGVNLHETVKLWGASIAGRDLDREFVKLTKLRLVLSAVARGVCVEDSSWRELLGEFRNICVGDGMVDDSSLGQATHIVMNPPFISVQSPLRCDWTSGKVNSAALFMEHYIQRAKPGTEIVAILPDVLRCGTRYRKWRTFVMQNVEFGNITLHGEFDRLTDVDVFILNGTIGNDCSVESKNEIDWDKTSHSNSHNVSDYFEVRVGPVVHCRDQHSGPLLRFVDTSNTTPWKVISDVVDKRRFSGTVFTPPFLVVRRTSSPQDKNRVAATMIVGKDSVAVENHLLVLIPKDGTQKTCKHFMKIMENGGANQYMNQKIRCRHLTVSALSEMPYEGIAR